jgi:hypothetical protein
MKIKLFVGKLLLFSIPFLLFLGLYFYLDPFKVVKHYDSYYRSGPNYITLNKDYVSTENWINHHQQYNYDSYIFGNSRSMFYQVSSWKNYIGTDSCKCYHFDASGESLYGIARKCSFLAQQNIKLKNVLIILDQGLLNKADNSAGHLFIKDPRLSGESRLGFQVDMMKDFFDFDFLRALLDFKMSGKIKDYMKKEFLLDERPFQYDKVTNEIRLAYYEEMIKKDPAQYYVPRDYIFVPRDTITQTVSPPVIKALQMDLLDTIRRIFKENQADVKVVVSPLYDQKKINPADLHILQSVFGEKNVFDFSGINAITRDKYNYYEISHYRPHVADQIMSIVYGADRQTAAN